MPTLIQYVCQRCRAQAELRAALRPPSMQPCGRCGGHLQAVRLVSGREARRRLAEPVGR